MSKKIINTPQLGVNDLSAEIIEWLISDGQEILIGDLLCTIETTKTVVDIESDANGYVKLLVPEGTEVKINQPICIIYSSLNEYKKYSDIDSKSLQKSIEPESLVVTKKAQKLIDANDIDINQHFKSGIVKEKDVVKLIDSLGKDFNEINIIARKNNIFIYGASQGGYTALEALRLNGNNDEIIGFIDDDIQKCGKKSYGLPVSSPSQIEAYEKKEHLHVFIAIANSSLRENKTRWAKKNGIIVITVRHPNTYISPSAKIGNGCYIKAGAVIDSNTIIGDGCIIDNNATIAHDNKIGKFCHLAPGVSLGSNIVVGDKSIIGIGSSISTGIIIGANNIISVGSAVTINTPPHSILEGAPAKIIGRTK